MSFNREQKGWILYDWANSAFATSILAVLFPIYFKEYLADEIPHHKSTIYLGIINSLAGLFFAIITPFLGAIGDRFSYHRHFIFFSILVGSGAVFFLGNLSNGYWYTGGILFLISTVAFYTGNVFYDALLPRIAGAKNLAALSSIGFAAGYLGGGILLLLHTLVIINYKSFHLETPFDAMKIAFISVALWWFIFSIPLLMTGKKENNHIGVDPISIVKDLIQTIKTIIKNKHVALFLVSYWMYIDGIDTIVRMAVDYGISIGIGRNSLITALLITQFTAFPFSLLFIKFAHRFGELHSILGGIFFYFVIIVSAAFIQNSTHFYILAVMVGMVQGGVQAMSRSYFSSIIPAGDSAKYFSFYNLVGKSAVIFGPLLISATVYLGVKSGLISPQQSPRLGILSTALLFIIAIVLLFKIEKKNNQKYSKQKINCKH